MNYDNPFPGMNPYLEQPRFWPGVHNDLIAQMRTSLGPQLPLQYRMEINERLEIDAAFPVDDAAPRGIIPDLSITAERDSDGGVLVAEPSALEGGILVKTPAPARVTFLEVRQAPDDQVVTVVEILSPTNKAPGSGRTDYIRKREDMLTSPVSLVEIDLLRGGEPMPLTTPLPPCHYRILVSREWGRPSARLFPFTVTNSIPKFPLPLREGDVEIEADIGPLLASMHHTARYNMAVNYALPPPGPALDPETLRWVEAQVASFRAPA